MKRKSLSLNAFLNAFRSILNLLFPLITYPYITGVLSVEELGQYNFSVSVINYFVLIAGLGISSYAIREGARIREDREKLTKFANQMLAINLISCAISYVLLFIILMMVSKLNDYRYLIWILSIQIIFTTIGVEWLYAIYEEYQYITIRSIIFKIISIILLFVFVRREGDVVQYAVVTMFAITGSSILDALFAKKYFKFSLKNIGGLGKHIRPIMILFASNVAVMIYVYSDTTMLGLMTNDYTVGIYSVSSKIYSMMKNILSAVLVVSIPRLSNLYGMGKIKEFKSTIQRIIDMITVLLIPSIIGIMIQADNIILFISNNKYLQARSSLIILSIGLIFCMYGWIFNQCILLPTKHEKIILIATIISAIENIVLNFIFINLWKENAAAFSTLVAELTMMIICGIYAKRIYNYRIFNKNFVGVLIGGIGIVGVCKLIKSFLLSSFTELFISIVISGIIYIMILCVLRNDIIFSFVDKIRNKIAE